MYVGQDFFPVDEVEDAAYGVDFYNKIPQGTTIASAVVTCENAPDTPVFDPSPEDRITAGPFIEDNTIVTVRVSGVKPNVKYLFQFTATSNGGNVYNLFTHMTGEAPF